MKEIWVPLSGAIAQQKKVETIANNVANANTPGFKRDQLTFREHVTILEKGNNDIDLPNKAWKPEDFYRSHGAENSHVKVDGKFTNHSQGDLMPTGNPLDIAIQGKGFIEILTPNGVRFTRKGILTLSNSGNLVNDQGFPVLAQENPNSKDQNPVSRVIQAPFQKIKITKKGEIFNGSNLINTISVVEFKDLSALQKEGNSMFINPFPKNLQRNLLKSNVMQGFIEQSNVNVVNEMSHLINANRSFESIQRVIKTYDKMSEKSTNEMLRF